jgi:hypothetical protein
VRYIGTEAIVIAEVLHKISGNINRCITYRSAFSADEVEMSQLFSGVIGSATMAEVGVLNKSHIFKGFQVAIDGREVDTGMCLTHLLGNLFRCGMAEFADGLKY